MSVHQRCEYLTNIRVGPVVDHVPVASDLLQPVLLDVLLRHLQLDLGQVLEVGLVHGLSPVVQVVLDHVLLKLHEQVTGLPDMLQEERRHVLL